MTTQELCKVLNDSADLLARGITPTSAQRAAFVEAMETVRRGEKLVEVPRKSVTYRVDGAIIHVVYDHDRYYVSAEDDGSTVLLGHQATAEAQRRADDEAGGLAALACRGGRRG